MRARARSRGAAEGLDSKSEVENFGLEVESATQDGKLFVDGDKERMKELENLGYRIKILRDTNILELGNHRHRYRKR